MTDSREGLIYDWNTVDGARKPPFRIEFDDETLRDGLQSPSVTNPTIDEKLRIFHLMERLGIDACDIALPGAGPHAAAHAERLAREKVAAKMKIQISCAARTVKTDIEPIAEISQKVGIPIVADVFIGSSPIRQYVEGWDLGTMVRHTREAVDFCRANNLPCMYVTEDTTRADPKALEILYSEAIGHGASMICLCDTVGHATPEGARSLVSWAKRLVDRLNPEVKINWHGHSDRNLAIPNTIAAIEAGAQRVHATALGIGERVGNTAMDLLLVNLKLLGWIDRDLRALPEYVREVSRACKVPVPRNYPVFGEDAFETGTGVHAAAVIKAFKKNDTWLANRVYSGVPADEFGLEQRIRVGPMSGRSNVVFWLEKNGYGASDDLVTRLFNAAKKTNHVFSDEELHALARGIVE
ncbi:MAG: 2-isopropylmalate synthase [Planctomycetes bacterium]|nr:2-isopropylmalate synthase [Planctomycetota bacterium]